MYMKSPWGYRYMWRPTIHEIQYSLSRGYGILYIETVSLHSFKFGTYHTKYTTIIGMQNIHIDCHYVPYHTPNYPFQAILSVIITL
jgi:hypothetical protein